MEVIEIKNPAKMWWVGDPRVEPYMENVNKALDRHFGSKYPHNRERIDIYNRCYEAVYKAIKDGDLKCEPR